MSKANNDLRMAARGNGVPLWAIAEQQGISEQTLIRRWRQELLEPEKEKIYRIIQELKVGVVNAK